MPLKLMYITKDKSIAEIAENSGVDWIFIDLEIIGKEERQGHLDTVISLHHIEDVKTIKQTLKKAELLVRVNPIYEGSEQEIDRVITDGADIVMLPYFKTLDEIKKFLEFVNGRSKVCLLLETPQAVEILDSILSLQGIDYIHIGLNDLHLGYGMKFMFEPLANGMVEMLCGKIKAANILYGFGGIAQIGNGALPAEYIITEHYRLGSSMAILSRSFCDVSKIECLKKTENMFKTGIENIRNLESELVNKDSIFFENNKKITKKKILEIKKRIIALQTNSE